MRYYNGFSLKNEEYLFGDYLSDSDYSICGFSYGAIKAFQELKRELELGNRVDKLILISPAFFQTKPIKFKKLQLMAYRKNKERYLKQFIDSCFSPYQKKIVEHKETTIEELDELLNYEWIVDEFKILEQKGIKVEVYLGGEDKIIDVAGARELFLKVSTVTYIKSVNHFLQIN